MNLDYRSIISYEINKHSTHTKKDRVTERDRQKETDCVCERERERFTANRHNLQNEIHFIMTNNRKLILS